MSRPERTSFRAPQGCLAEARRSARSAFSTGRRGSGLGDNGVARKRNAEARTGVSALVAMATRSFYDPVESLGRSCQPRLAPHPELCGPAGVTQATSASAPHFLLLRLNYPLFLKGTLSLGDEDAGDKSHLRTERSAGLYDATYCDVPD